MTDKKTIGSADAEREIFWGLYKKYLKEENNPFYISSERQIAIINRPTPNWSKPCISIDFSVTKKILRVGVFILNDIKLYNSILPYKDLINEKFFPLKPIWCETEQSKTARRVKIEIPFNDTSKNEYERIIRESANYVKIFIDCFRAYIEC